MIWFLISRLRLHIVLELESFASGWAEAMLSAKAARAASEIDSDVAQEGRTSPSTSIGARPSEPVPELACDK
jgi:hypothetical protein